jgi:hypothetical protein
LDWPFGSHGPVLTGSLVLAPPLDRCDGSAPRSTAAAPAPPLEVEHLGPGGEPEPEQKVGRQQRGMMAGGTIDLDEIATPEILDPRQVAQATSPDLARAWGAVYWSIFDLSCFTG